MPRIWALIVLGLLVALVLPTLASAWDNDDNTYSYQRTPFSGWWDRFYIAHPAYPDYHARSQCEAYGGGWLATKPDCNDTSSVWGPGDWATDYYNVPGTAVKFKSLDLGKSYKAKVYQVSPTCSSGSAGYTVFIDLWVSGGGWEGWVAYGHLSSVQVSIGQVLSQDQLLGYTSQYTYQSGCWEVSNSAGVHTHVEMYNYAQYSCYTALNSGTYYPIGFWLGVVGRTIYGSPQLAC